MPTIRKSREPDFSARRHPRLPTFSFVEICSEDGELLMEATVREISKNGAQLMGWTGCSPEQAG